MQATTFQGRGRQAKLPIPSMAQPCECPMPIRCDTDGDGWVIQTCLRCGAANIVERRPGIPTVSKARAAELRMFGPIEAS